jgi:hypothetical protein
MKRYPHESQEVVNAKFHRSLQYGRMWENYLMNALPVAYPEYDVEHVQDILGFDTYRLNDNKYPDFRLTLHKNKQTTLRPCRLYIDAKRKRGYSSQDPPHEEFLTCDKSFIDSYNNIVQQDRDNGYDATGLLMFWHEKTGAYMAPLEPHNWIDFGPNGYGSDLSGQFWIKQLIRMHEFDDFAEDIATDIAKHNKHYVADYCSKSDPWGRNHDLSDWVDAFKKTETN